jgi:hypothetical protein
MRQCFHRRIVFVSQEDVRHGLKRDVKLFRALGLRA